MINKKLLFIFFFAALSVLNAQDLVVPKDIQKGVSQIILGERDPFQRPKYIDDLEEDVIKTTEPVESTEDQRVESIRRWPLREYKLIAVIWDVSNPKVMILDRKGTMHLLKKNYRIGNRNGIITAVNEGEIIVLENSIPTVMRIQNGEATQSVDPQIKTPQEGL